MSRLLPAIAPLKLPRFCHRILTWFLIPFRHGLSPPPLPFFFLIDRNRGVEKEEGVMRIKEICKKSLLKRFWGNEKKVSESCQFNFFFFLFCGVGRRSITLCWSVSWFLLCPLCVRFVGGSAIVAPEDTRQLTVHLPPVTALVFRALTAHSCVDPQLRLTTDTNRL